VAAAGVLQGAQLVQLGRDPVAGEAAVPGEEGRLVGEGGGQALAEARGRVEAGGDVGQGGLGGEGGAELGRALQGLGDGQQVAGAAAAEG
jgi:hypothetical protein